MLLLGVRDVVRYVCPTCQQEGSVRSATECICGAYVCSLQCLEVHLALRHPVSAR